MIIIVVGVPFRRTNTAATTYEWDVLDFNPPGLLARGSGKAGSFGVTWTRAQCCADLAVTAAADTQLMD
jgi:hypothetical protein